MRPLHAGLTLAVLLAGLWFAGQSALGASQTAHAAPAYQIPIYTPTPGPDGRIIYIVKANDTLLGISLITGVSVEELRGLNNLTSDTIYEGQKLLLGLAGPPEITPTIGPTPTATPVLPSPTPKPGKGDLCILLFNDRNGDSIRQEDEASIPEGAISFGNRAGSVSESTTTLSGSEHQCFEDLPEGEYTITIAVPEGYNPTTRTTNEVSLRAGETTYQNFGAQANSQAAGEIEVLPEEGEKSPLLGIIGGLFLVAGIGVAIFAGRMLRSG
ncbi:MAG: LysM peptidoglycan-binding domain-containing protein [Anaerolineales bacterium]|nr:LysM peptidoglycan-binding domain-containing protein [Anaerolineales bacterium]